MSDSESAARILVVNDEAVIREIIVSILTSAGYQCATASDGIEALAMLDSGQEFELLLSNFMMPNLDGIGLLERTRERFPDMVFVLESAMQDASVFSAALEKGAYDYLQIPFTRETLLAVVHRALEYRRHMLENRGYQAKLESLVAERTEKLKNAISDLERSYDLTVENLGTLLAMKDAETERHSRRVTAFAIAIARAMGLSVDRIAEIARGAFLHDIGKVSIPEKILLKPSSLTPDETAVVRQHCAQGYEILRKVPFLAEPAEIVYSHHENYDGSGYPRDLKGEEIPLGARLVAVANTLDAITRDRPYRPAQSLAAAREEIHRWSGRQFDPEVVQSFLAMPQNIWTDLSKAIDHQE
ncbi:MAG TPA: HD domain-containing phosphohydrolase [Terriglobales bacterium]|nr:HD domain-containing phosphohydrolase [Terriglobales bacterium]